MSNINCGIGVLHVKREILTYFVVTSFLCSLKCSLFNLIGCLQGVYKKILKMFYGSVFVIWLYQRAYTPPTSIYSFDCTFKKQCTVHVTLTFDLWKSMFFQWFNNDPMSVLYEFQIDISTNGWEIKYQNMGIGLLQVKRRTRQKWR